MTFATTLISLGTALVFNGINNKWWAMIIVGLIFYIVGCVFGCVVEDRMEDKVKGLEEKLKGDAE